MHNMQTANQFSAFKSHLKAQFGADIYKSYFQGLDLGEASSERVTFVTPTRYAASLISKRYALRMRQMWSEHVSPVDRVDIKAVQEMPFKSSLQERAGTQMQTAVAVGTGASAVSARPIEQMPSHNTETGDSTFVRGMVFDRFCVNDTNRFAFHAAKKLLDSPEPAVTVIHGPAGRGKTHLLNAVGQEWLRRHPGDKVLYLPYDTLVTDVCEAFISRSLKELRTFLRDTDLLLIDDIQMLRGRKRTQEELDCLIDKLRGAGKRVMVAGALPPKELAETGISQRLAGRLAGGLCVAVGDPDIDLLIKVARQWADEAAAHSGVAIPQKHIELVARRCDGSVRDLEGALELIQVATEAEAEAGGFLTDEAARLLLKNHFQRKQAAVTPESILSFTTDLFDVSREELGGRSRKQNIVRARHAFCFAVRKLTDTPLKSIGAVINRDHTTVMHSVRTAEILAETDPTFGGRITKIFDEFPHG
ncbi:MAG: DnaA/Hda family protein [Pseudomonadota bacterium]